MSSQQLVRRLLRVTDYDAPPSVNPKTKRASTTTTIDESSPRPPPPKRQRRRKHAVEEAITGSSESVMTEQEALDWHVRTRLLNVDRQMAVRGSLHSNTRAMDQSLQRLEAKTTTKQQRASDTTLQSAVNAIRTGSGSRRLPPQNIPEPTFNKKRYAEETKRKKMDELKKALKSLERDKKKKKKRKTKQSS